MITAIVDTNVFVQAAISPKGAAFQVLKAHLDGNSNWSRLKARSMNS